jgi:hypothetical protein
VRAANKRGGGGGDDEDAESDMDDDGEPVPFVHEVAEQKDAEWLAAMVSAGTFGVRCDLLGPLNKQMLLSQSSRVDVCFAPTEEPLDALTWQRATAGIGASTAPPPTWPYLIYNSAYIFSPEPVLVPSPPVVSQAPLRAERSTADADYNDDRAVVDVEQPPASRPADASAVPTGIDQTPTGERSAAFVAAQDDLAESAAPVATVVRAYEPLRYFAHHVPLAELTIYEIETYARARLHWHVVRLSKQERAGCGDDDEWFDRSARSSRTSRYPQTSGAQRALLRMIGADAVAREEHHEAIGLGVLALVAEPQPALRDNLLYLEALAIEARSCADRDAINDEVAAHLQLLERFWDMCGPVVYSTTSASTLDRVMASIAADWQSGLGAGT